MIEDASIDPVPEEPGDRVAAEARRGRGAVSNRTGRYERYNYRPFDDGWDREEEAAPLRTQVLPDTSRSVITYNKSPDLGFDRSINPYRGCEHGCFYCYARPSHAWLGLSPGLDFESRIFAKLDAPALLRQELAKESYEPAPITLAANTDAYQPLEKELKLTRGILEVLREARHPVTIVTKSQMILRDIDILAEMAERRLVRVAVSVTTLDRHLARRMEPRAATPPRRLDVIRSLSRAGIPTMVMMAPIVPALTDHEIESLLEAAAGAGAMSAGYTLLRLPLEIAGMAEEWLAENVPDRAQHVLSLMRNTRGGKLYDSRWFERRRGTGPYAELIAKRFDLARRRFGLMGPIASLETRHFRRPEPETGQLSLF
jgi:DNA repair photolyase